MYIDLGFDFTDDDYDQDELLEDEEEELAEDKPETQVVLYHSDKDSNEKSLIEAIATGNFFFLECFFFSLIKKNRITSRK